MAPEWESQGRITTAGTAPAIKFSWSNFPVLWNCWRKSASARMLARLSPTRSGRERAAASQAGCSCHAAPASAAAIKGEVQRHYSAQAQALAGCGDSGCCTPALPAELSALPMYSANDMSSAPGEALLASLGCGNPLARADLAPGEVVLDLGSGGGMDVMVAAARVAPGGKVFGLDASDEMLTLAKASASRVGARNVEFLKGDLESIPLPDESVDVIISNCVVNLAPDKDTAMSEAFRVLRPGGRLAISDIVTRHPVPAPIRENLAAWAACIGGALSEGEYRDRLGAAGFTDVAVYRDREYTAQDAEAAGLSQILAQAGLDTALRLGFASAGICARKEGARVTAGAQANQDTSTPEGLTS
jgi:SAM-dependent methyltransferase